MTKTNNKNQKISTSLKKYHKKKRIRIDRKKELKAIIWILLFVGLLGLYKTQAIVKPLQAQSPYARMNASFPVAGDKTNLTDKDKLFISATKECLKRDLGEYCVNDLMAMAYTESRFNCNAIGDNGASHGCFQIHLGYHKHITQDQARDIDFAVKWTLDRMVHYNYPEYRSYAIMKHNGTPNTKKTLAYLKAVNNY